MSRRRYRIGVYPEYDRMFDGFKVMSPILNPSRYQCNEAAMRMFGKGSLRSFIADYEDKGGYISRYEEEVEAIEEEFSNYQQEATNLGKSIADEMPKKMRRNWLEAQARLDIKLEELDRLRKVYEEIDVKDREAADRRVLYYGPIGVGRHDPLKEIDGQAVGQTENGELVISDNRSPYNGMLVRDYREFVVKPFVRNQERCKRNRRISSANLPPWPENVKQHSEPEVER